MSHASRTAEIVLRCVSLALLLAACDRVDAVESSPAAERSTAPSSPAPVAMPEPVDELRARAIREAESFVRAQGYTEAAPTVSGDAVVREGIEGTLEERRGMLDPTAVSAAGGGDRWSVVFRYRDPQYAGRGRALQIQFGEVPRFVHQDRLLDPAPSTPSE